jgi:hypothetical protein
MATLTAFCIPLHSAFDTSDAQVDRDFQLTCLKLIVFSFSERHAAPGHRRFVHKS